MSMHPPGKRQPRWWAAKYAMERSVAAAAMIVAIPILLLLALLVKLTSPGTAMYVSDRLGRGGRVFRLYKLRSMHMGVAPVLGLDGKVLTLKQDARVTPVGRFLRLGFDELPQLFNVVKGDMCLIGPRPDIPSEVERYSVRERRRLDLLPGITGLAQVAGGRQMNNAQNYELDVLYAERSTWRTDLLILLLTLPCSFGMERLGAHIFRQYVEAVAPLVITPSLEDTNKL